MEGFAERFAEGAGEGFAEGLTERFAGGFSVMHPRINDKGSVGDVWVTVVK